MSDDRPKAPPVEIFWISGSPYAWRVLLALALKGAPFTSRLLSVSKGELSSPEFLAVNPRGKVPALRDGELTMGESMAIVRYIDRRFPDPPLFGLNHAEEARINQKIDEIENYLVPETGWITRVLFVDSVAGREEGLNARAERVRTELGNLETQVNTWLVGDAINATDISLYPIIAALLRAAGKPAAADLDLRFLPFAERYPRLAQWCGRIEALPGFDATYPPHWRE